MTLLNRIRADASAAELPAIAVFRSMITDVLLAAPAFTTHRWSFSIADEALDISIDARLRGSHDESSTRERLMSCGAALALLEVAARHRGVALEVRPTFDRTRRLATVRIGGRAQAGRADRALFSALRRSSDATRAWGRFRVGRNILDALRRAGAREGARFEPLTVRQLESTMDPLRALPSAAWLAEDEWQPVHSVHGAGAIVTPGDGPGDWMAAGEALAMLQLTSARRGVHVVVVASAAPIIRSLRPELKALLRGPGEPQVLLTAVRRRICARRRGHPEAVGLSKQLPHAAIPL